MEIDIHWRKLGEEDDGWDFTRVLYAYVCPRMREILYVGKSDGARSSVWTRARAADKLAFWDALRLERGINGADVLVGELMMVPGARLTRELLADVESLLIAAEQPWGNIQSRLTRISRPGLVVRCRGQWRGARVVKDG